METLKNELTVTGEVEILLLDKDQKIKKQIKTHNLVVATGKALIASQLIGETNDGSAYIARPAYMAVGTGSGNPSASQTTLEEENARVAIASVTRTQNTVTYEAQFEPTVGTGVLREVAMFNGETDDAVMMNRAVYPILTKESQDTVIFRWNVTIN